MMGKVWDSWMFVVGIMSITSCIDRCITAHDRETGTGEFKGCVCAPKEVS